MAAAAFLAVTLQQSYAQADSDTRTLSFYHTHTQETATVTFRRNGRYDEQALAQLNWFLRDWRNNKPTKMDPHLFDVLWEVYRASGSKQPINIISSYRSPETNGALRRRSSGVAEHSQHMLGKAMDIRLPDVSTDQLRAIAMRLQYGGVGYYPSSAFVHVDTGNVRAWPRMTEQQLARLFPDGKTVHLPTNGKPLAGYEQAKAEIEARNAALASAGSGSIGGLLANLFGRKAPEAAPVEKTALAYAPTDGAKPMVPAAPPLPPQRPVEQVLATASLSSAAAAAASVDQTEGFVMKPILGFNEKAAMEALFDPRASLPSNGFSQLAQDELSTTRFTGPAVKPVPNTPEPTLGSLLAKADGNDFSALQR